MPQSGHCYTLASADLRYTWGNSDVLCKQMLPEYSAVKVHIAEARDAAQADALKSFLVRMAVKEKVWLGASRSCKCLN